MAFVLWFPLLCGFVSLFHIRSGNESVVVHKNANRNAFIVSKLNEWELKLTIQILKVVQKTECPGHIQKKGNLIAINVNIYIKKP